MCAEVLQSNSSLKNPCQIIYLWVHKRCKAELINYVNLCPYWDNNEAGNGKAKRSPP